MDLMKIKMQEYHSGGTISHVTWGKNKKKNRVIQVCLFETERHGSPITRRGN